MYEWSIEKFSPVIESRVSIILDNRLRSKRTIKKKKEQESNSLEIFFVKIQRSRKTKIVYNNKILGRNSID